MLPGKFIVIEGMDGIGKSTLALNLRDALVLCGENVLLTAEPTKTEIGLFIRKLISGGYKQEDISPLALLHLFMADRYQHLLTTIIPALRRGDTVICDRFILSTLVYQAVQVGVCGVANTDYFVMRTEAFSVHRLMEQFLGNVKTLFLVLHCNEAYLETVIERVMERENKDAFETAELMRKNHACYAVCLSDRLFTPVNLPFKIQGIAAQFSKDVVLSSALVAVDVYFND